MEDILLNTNIYDTDSIELRAETALKEAGDNYQRRKEAIDNLVKELVTIDAFTAESIIASISKKCKIRKKLILDEYNKSTKADKTIADEIQNQFDDDIQYNEFKNKGFWQKNHSYYFYNKDGVFKASNFTIKPLIHIYSKIADNNKRIIEIINEYSRKKSIDIPSKIWVSLDAFQGIVIGEGNYLFFGSSFHFKRILGDINESFPEANELRTMGWQSEGFWAFSNGIFDGEKWQPVDNLGITEFKNVKYFTPAFSEIYKNVRQDDDEHKADRFFVYKEPKISFSNWADLMRKVYLDKGMIAVAYMCAAIFRDFIYDQYKIFPHLFLFGETQSGKSQLGWSLSNVFYDNLPPFNLTSGTQVGFFRRLARIKNGISWYDEYSNDIDEKRFQALKSAYDGVGHEKGKMSRDNRTEVTEVNQALCISGQYLPTRDDNSVFNRSLMLFFSKRDFTQEQIEAYDYLKKLEGEGFSGIIFEVLKHRKLIEKNYPRVFSELFEVVKASLLKEGDKDDHRERTLRNYTIILAVAKILITDANLDLGFTYPELLNLCMFMIKDQNSQISNSEGLSTFFKMVEYMFENLLISRDKDFAIGEYMSISVSYKGESITKTWDNPVKLLFLRLTNIHPIYLEAHRKQHGKTGIDLTSLTHYIKQSKAYVGESRSYRFETQNTSAFVFLYDKINISLEKDNGLMMDKQTQNEKKDPPF